MLGWLKENSLWDVIIGKKILRERRDRFAEQKSIFAIIADVGFGCGCFRYLLGYYYAQP
ncbi:MAG: hypothetical protein ACOX0E_01995 [Syntrophomonadaceae bacterium]